MVASNRIPTFLLPQWQSVLCFFVFWAATETETSDCLLNGYEHSALPDWDCKYIYYIEVYIREATFHSLGTASYSSRARSRSKGRRWCVASLKCRTQYIIITTGYPVDIWPVDILYWISTFYFFFLFFLCLTTYLDFLDIEYPISNIFIILDTGYPIFTLS